MKKTILVAIATLFCTIGAFAQGPKQDGKDCDWKQKIKSEKIGFITSELSLTPEEAQVFWPVYNQISELKDKVMHKVHKSYKELEEATQKGGDAAPALEQYIKAQKEMQLIDDDAVRKYKSVLPVEKVAKLYVAEERFRRMQINRLHKN